VAALLALVTSAAAEPKPKPVDTKAFKDQLIALTDADGGVYIILPGKDSRMWFGVISRYSDGSTGAWDLGVWAPRVSGVQPGSVLRKDDGSFERHCGNDSKIALTQLPADKAKALIDKTSFFSSAMIRRPYLLARDDAAVYYYVDVIRKEYGGNGFRVFIGKKGAMKQKPLTDVASDTAGDVFSTKTGDLRIVRDVEEGGKQNVAWVKGEKRASLVTLDTDANSPLIFKDLGVYGFTGSICENL